MAITDDFARARSPEAGIYAKASGGRHLCFIIVIDRGFAPLTGRRVDEIGPPISPPA
jgi:hypothetical protein